MMRIDRDNLGLISTLKTELDLQVALSIKMFSTWKNQSFNIQNLELDFTARWKKYQPRI